MGELEEIRVKTKRFPRRSSALAAPFVFAIVLALDASVRADSLYSEERTVTRLADGVYTIRHQDPYPGWVNGNTTVIIGEREVLVVDSCQFSYFAREDIAQIREWTPKPVHYLVNTHWHEDHNSGNRDYMEAFAGLAIVAHPATRDMLADTAPSFPRDVMRDAAPLRDKLEHRLQTGKADDGQPLTDAARSETEARLAQIDRVIGALPGFSYQLPTLTFERELHLDLGNREVEVKHLGRGNTAGDVVVYLPEEKILVSGDLLVSPVPFAFDGYPVEWIETLKAIDRLDAGVIVPGHGEVLHDESFLHLVIETMSSVVDQVHDQLRKNDDADLVDVKHAVALGPFRERFAGEDAAKGKFFDYSMGDKFVDLAFHEAKQR
jgi:glyoxylase-like metal-dependent hydrolase (beta-lactamase superfamily II)